MRHPLPGRARAALAAAMIIVAAAPTASHAAPDPLDTETPRQLRLLDDQFRFIALFLSRAEASNIAPTNDFLQGQTIGRLFGPNSATTSSNTSLYAEQRLIPFFIFEPRILNQKVRLRLAFDLKFTWGDANYGVGGNFGGAINSHQVNLQTTNAEVEINLPWTGWYVDVGLQRLYDNVRDPYRTLFSTLSLTGERLAFWGADAVGVTVHGNFAGNMVRLGFFDLYSNKISQDDDVFLSEVVYDRWLGGALHVGGNVRWVRDTSSGLGGIGILGQGPNSGLTEYNGVFRFKVGNDKYAANVVWTGLDLGWNPEFTAGRFGGSAFVVGNFGSLAHGMDTSTLDKSVSILGLAADARFGWKYGRTRNDLVTAEVIYTSGDGNGISDNKYTGVVTGNTWGSPGAAFTTSGAYLLLPHLTVVNRYYAAVSDLSNMGYGLTAATLNASYDLIRNNLTLKVGGALGFANAAPEGGGGGRTIGYEGNAMLAWRIGVFLSLEAHAAYMKLGNFYENPAVAATGKPTDPWTTFLALRWLMF